ncbi:penicillin-binding transpeptidase domain-containing protein [Anaerotignum faecicola]|uniref:penicillin-binding transpeptidase domain-containing protein n=1 Tax=Anaerotignum faecicola TaxID=2358141 RepID=UPI001A9B558A|nr:penicillin-binding transpeptidase domain-containing protein [Anaerotignum faecicola]
MGYKPCDSRRIIILVDGSEFRNYDTKSHGNVSAYDALRQSFNIPALKTWQQVKKSAGNDAPKKFASKVGLDYSGKIGPSEVLGGSSSEFSPTQLASAFAAIANGGTYNNAHSIQKLLLTMVTRLNMIILVTKR